ncbi:ABC transporter ATP-binding protein [Ruminococcus sp. OM05-7]|jgi:ABC-2 type transport system ATP-binding protein|uniref:ABC transporter ATP-binding protein n=1 Tax=Blautia sp. TaxID=1955243 RepID=UPI000E47F42F|nr:ABC transporter ATP-binding protein [Ruminococcus sp. OM05-7]
MHAIQVDHVVKRYKNGVQALNGLSLSVKEGEIFSLLGQNGAGKSTLIRILTTYLCPTAGEIEMMGKDIKKDAAVIRSQIACVAQQTSIDTYLSLEENMMFQSRLYKIPKAEARQRMERLISDFGLSQYRKYPVSSYSGGVKRRLDIALNMMVNPKILFLDEPTVGMDIQSRIAMWDMMKKIRDGFGTTIFLTTHYLEEADSLSDNVCIIKDGKEVTQGTPAELRSLLRQHNLQVKFSSSTESKANLGLFQMQFQGKKFFQHGNIIVINTYSAQSDLLEITSFLLKQNIPFVGIEITEPTLEDVFLRLTQNGQEDQE